MEESVKTSVLSKSFGDVWSTQPRFFLNQTLFYGSTKQFLEVLDKTLQGYHDRNLSMDIFRLTLTSNDAIPTLEKWIPTVPIKEFELRYEYLYLDRSGEPESIELLPPIVFESQHLQTLNLTGWDLNKAVGSTDILRFKSLKRLELIEVCITDNVFQKITSGIPLVEYLVTKECKELNNIKVTNKASHLKVFHFEHDWKANPIIEIDVPAIEEINIIGCLNWSHRKNHFLHLKSLHLDRVQLSSKYFEIFSSDFPYVESLMLMRCYEFQRLQLSSASIKHLSLVHMEEKVKMIKIDAPNIVRFYCEGRLPQIFSFTTTSDEWSSELHFYVNRDRAWLIRLKGVLKELVGSKISLYIDGLDPQEISGVSRFRKPVSMEELWFNVRSRSLLLLSDFIKGLFRISCPREIHVLGQKVAGNQWSDDFDLFDEILRMTLMVEEEKPRKIVEEEKREIWDWE